MKLNFKTFTNRSKAILSRAVPATLAVTAALGLAKPAEAAVFDLFLIAEQTETLNGGETSILPQTVFQLGGFNGNNKATTSTLITDLAAAGLDALGGYNPLTVSSVNDPSGGPSKADPFGAYLTDQDEPLQIGGLPVDQATYINNEISTVDGGAGGADSQLNMGRNSDVTFNPFTGGMTELALFDVGGLDPFALSFCVTADCISPMQLFNGLTSSLSNALIGTGLFGFDDVDAFDPTTNTPSNQNQTWVFKFNDPTPITDFLQITEAGDRSVFRGDRLAIDYLGAKGTNIEAPSPVPGPAGLPLLASGFALLGWGMRRKKG